MKTSIQFQIIAYAGQGEENRHTQWDRQTLLMSTRKECLIAQTKVYASTKTHMVDQN